MKTKIIHSDWLALQLKVKGFVCTVRRNLKNPDRDVYVFLDSRQLQKAMTEILGNK